MSVLVAVGAAVNAVNDKGQTALDIARREKNVAAETVLLKEGR